MIERGWGKMRKFFLMTALLSVVFALSACGESHLKSNTIVEAELTDRENAILSMVSNQSFVFDFNIDDEYSEATVWIEKYEFGKRVDDLIGGNKTQVTENGSIIFTTTNPESTLNQTFFNLGVSSNGSTGSSTVSDIISNNGEEGMHTMWGSINEEMDVTNGELVLASICYSWGDGSMRSLSPDFYKDVESHINEIENYDVVYLLKSKFTK